MTQTITTVTNKQVIFAFGKEYSEKKQNLLKHDWLKAIGHFFASILKVHEKPSTLDPSNDVVYMWAFLNATKTGFFQ